MHLKNFSLITRKDKVEFSPAYDLINSTLVMGGAEEEMALMLAGKRKEFRYRELVTYLGVEKLGLTFKSITSVLQNFEKNAASWLELIDQSFLSEVSKKAYKDLLLNRLRRLQHK